MEYTLLALSVREENKQSMEPGSEQAWRRELALSDDWKHASGHSMLSVGKSHTHTI